MKKLNDEEISKRFNGRKKLKNWQIALIVSFGLGIIGGAFFDDSKEELSLKESQKSFGKISNDTKLKENTVMVCDGIEITENCELNGKQYILYKYYPAIEEVSHTEIVTKYKTEIIGYCTLCKDGTYSPTCATGRGACSHHGGVAQWNAPIYSQVAYNEEIKVIDVPAVAERYEIIEKKLLL